MNTVSRIVLAAVLFVSFCFGQSDRASVTGTVSDATGAIIANAVVEVSDEQTGLRRSTFTNRAGVYTIAGLPIGTIRISFTKEGFQQAVYSDVQLTVGQNRQLNVMLSVATVADQIEVRESLPPLSQTNANISSVIQSEELASTPLNGRQWQGLLALSPGAINTGNGDASGVRFAGRGADDNLIRMDGVDVAGVRNLNPRGNPRLTVSLESIAEFRVNAALYTAESGGSMGAQVDLVSKTGSNELRGTLFHYLRNDALDARSPFDGSTLPPFRLNQFGGSLGGPVVKDRTFFFVTYEGLRQRRGQTLIGFVPSDAFRARVMQTSPELRPILDAYPLGMTPTNDPNVSQRTVLGNQIQDEDSTTFRVDHRVNEKTTVFFRGNLLRSVTQSPLGGADGFLDLTQRVNSDVLNGVVSLQQVITPTILNEFKVGANRLPSSQRRFNPFGFRVTIPGFTRLAEADIEGAEFPTRYTVMDNLTLIRGKHTVKAGFEFRPTHYATRRRGDGNAVAFANITDFLNNRVNSVQVTDEQFMIGMSKNVFGAYIQDEWKILPELTLNLGVRYDYFGVLSEMHNRQFPFDFETCGGFCPAGSAAAFPDTNNIQPRVSLAWSPRQLGGRTVIRTGFGMFYGEGQLGNQLSPFENSTARTLLSIADFPGLRYPFDPFLQQAGSVANAPRASQRDRQDMYTMQYGFLVQQSVGDFVAEVGYMGNQARQLFLRSAVNVLDPALGARPFPQFNVLGFRGNGGVSNFNSMIATLRRSMSRGWLLSANYLWSHAIDEGAIGGDDSSQPQNVRCFSCERASSNFDVRHSLTLSSVYELPFGRGRRFLNTGGVLGAALGGWELSNIVSARTGRPVTVTMSRRASEVPDQNATSALRPDVVPGVSPVPAGGSTPGAWINPAAFRMPAAGTWGNAGRNLLRAPGVLQVDAALTKNVTLTERFTLQIRAEGFNILNRPQYALPEANWSSTGTFGRITSVLNTGATGTGTPRQFQLALRLNF